ncbi:hypothetical protein ACKVEX_08525 [Rhodocyclaceae bacterium SMB388]
MSTYTRLPAPSTPHAEPARSKPFMRTGPYAPHPRARSLKESLVAWEDEGGSLPDPPSA